MNIIVHHETAWEKTMDKYNIEGIAPPPAFPVLLSLNTYQDEDGDTIAMDVEAGKSVITPEQAAKLLSACSEERLLAIPLGVRQALVEALPKKENLIKILSMKPSDASKTKPSVITALDSEGMTVTFTSLHIKNLLVGDLLTINGHNYTVTSIGAEIVADSPIDNSNGIQEITDDCIATAAEIVLPGTEQIPMDPGKLNAKQKIADLGDALEHVLDVERAV